MGRRGQRCWSLADDMIAEDGLAGGASVLALPRRDPDHAASEWVQIILIEAMSRVIDALAEDVQRVEVRWVGAAVRREAIRDT